LPDRPGVRHGLLGNLTLVFDGWEGEQAAPMAGRESAVGDQLLEVGGKLQQAGEIDNGRAIFTGSAADLVGTQLQFGPHSGKSRSGLNRIQILPLNVLDEGDFEQPVVWDVAYDNRNLIELGKLRGPPPALPGDELVAIAQLPDHQRLDYAIGAD